MSAAAERLLARTGDGEAWDSERKGVDEDELRGWAPKVARGAEADSGSGVRGGEEALKDEALIWNELARGRSFGRSFFRKMLSRGLKVFSL